MLAAALGLIAALVQDVVPIEGIVRDKRLEPVEGAEVLVTRQDWRVIEGQRLFHSLKTDGEGRFRLELPRAELNALLWQNLWVYVFHPEHALGWIGLHPGMPPRGWELPILLGPPIAGSRLRIVAPDGFPLAGVRVLPESVIRKIQNATASEIEERLAATTDGEGWATFTLLPVEDLCAVRLESERFGVQRFRWPNPPNSGDSVALLPVGRIRGQLTAAGGRASVGGRTVVVATTVEGLDRGEGRGGTAEVVSDEQGRFEIPAIVAGTVRAYVAPTEDEPSGGELLEKPALAQGASLEVVVELKPALRVAGRIVEKSSGAPIAGLDVVVGSAEPVMVTTTDEDGQFAGQVVSPKFSVVISGTMNFFSFEAVANDAGEQQLGNLAIERGELRGTVVDEHGAPVPGAWVMAENAYSWVIVNAVADEAGRFELTGLPGGLELRIHAQRREARQAEPLVVELPRDEPLKLVVSSAGSIVPEGRVLDASGAPVAGGTVELWNRFTEDGVERSVRLFKFDPGLLVLTDAEGRFRSPRPVPGRGEFRATILAPDCLPGATAWTTFSPPDQARFEDVVLVPAPTGD